MHPDRVLERPAVRKLRLFLEQKDRAEGLAEGKAEGLAEGKAEGLAEGKAEGLAEGKAEGKREGLLVVLSERGLTPTEAERAVIMGCEDVSLLGTWLKRAVTAASVADVLAAAPSPRPAPKRPSTKRPAGRATAGNPSRATSGSRSRATPGSRSRAGRD